MEGKLSTVDRFLMKECMEAYQLLLTIPGISDNCCATILAEISPTIDAFKTDKKLASWSGMCPILTKVLVLKNLHTRRKAITILNKP